MKSVVLSIIAAALVISGVRGEATLTERQGKYLRFNGAPDLGKLNFDRILSQWNKSNAEETRPISVYSSEEPEVTTRQSQLTEEEKNLNVSGKDFYSVLMERSDGFKKCIFGQKKRILENASERKSIIFKCFKVEVIKGLRGLISECDSISLLNGYIVLEAVDKPGAKPSKEKKSRKKFLIRDKEHKTYSEYYQNIVDELFAENESSREFKDGGTGEIFSGYGRYLINEIAENLREEEEEMRSLRDSFMDNDLLSALGEMSRRFVLRLNLFRGVSAIMKRSQSTGVTFDLELDDLTGFGYDDDDDEEKKKKKKSKKKKGSVKGAKEEDSSEEYDDDDDDDDDDDEDDDDNEEEDEGEEEDGEVDDNRDAIIDQEGDDEEVEDEEPGWGKEKGKGKGKGGKKRKGGKGKGNKLKKKMKKFKKFIPYLIIPLLIQAAMLPLAFKFLLAFAIKALVAGKIALLLVAINLIKSTNFKSDEDEYIERVGQEHYGYGKGEEYGAWINKRAFDTVDDGEMTTENHPYRAYTPIEVEE